MMDALTESIFSQMNWLQTCTILPCLSQNSPYVSRVESGIDTEISNAYIHLAVKKSVQWNLHWKTALNSTKTQSFRRCGLFCEVYLTISNNPTATRRQSPITGWSLVWGLFSQVSLYSWSAIVILYSFWPLLDQCWNSQVVDSCSELLG